MIKATLLLFPLFGITFAIFFHLPPNTDTVFSKIYYCVNTFLQTTQGIMVAFVYCFYNDEVRSAVAAKFRSWKISHTGTMLYNFGSSFRNRPTTTYTTTAGGISHHPHPHHNTTRMRQDSAPNDPARLPMLIKEEKV
jgi:hypothetical protein